MLVPHQLSPELVLVDADLRAVALAALPERVWEMYAPARRAAEPPVGARAARGGFDRSLLVGAVLYAAWHALLGAILVSAAVLAVAVTLLALGFASG